MKFWLIKRDEKFAGRKVLYHVNTLIEKGKVDIDTEGCFPYAILFIGTENQQPNIVRMLINIAKEYDKTILVYQEIF